jgi:phosphonate transport system substrate-binding protein
MRFANFLSPLLQETYEYITDYLGASTGYPAILHIGQTLEEFVNGQTDVGFLCGLQYVRMTKWPACPVELLAAPVLPGERYASRPIYFSDVVVRKDSPYTSFDDLSRCTWAYNERVSHSGCNIVHYSLLQRAKAIPYFAQTLKSGSHLRSLDMVLEGRADATAIDSHVFEIFQRRNPRIAEGLRVIDMLGPSTIPPVVVAKRLDAELKHQLRAALVTMHHDAQSAQQLRAGLIDHFVPVTDDHYQDIDAMLTQVEAQTAIPFH